MRLAGERRNMEASYPLEFESVSAAPLDDEKLVVRVEGRWLTRHRPTLERAMLVVEANGRRHRFPAIPQPRRPRFGRSGGWSGGFALPTWLGPHLEGNTSLRLGETAMQLPVGSFAGLDEPEPVETSAAEAHGEPRAEPETTAVPERESDIAPQSETPPEPAAARLAASPTESSDPPNAEGMISALRAELERRAASEAALRGELVDVRAELAAVSVSRERLEATHAELRRELEELRDAVERRADVESRAVVLAARVEELQAELESGEGARETLDAELALVRNAHATSEVAREAAQAEAAGLRAELDRIGAELSQARQQQAGRGELEEAQSLLAEARALRTKMAERTTTGP
jgi:hypothetical protein